MCVVGGGGGGGGRSQTVCWGGGRGSKIRPTDARMPTDLRSHTSLGLFLFFIV